MKSKKSKTATKKSKKVKPPKIMVAPSIPLKKSVIEEIKSLEESPAFQFSEAVIEKLPFDMCNDAFDFFSYAFQENGSFENEKGEFYIDPRFTSMWTTFLVMAGWTEAEYWEMVDKMPHEKCEQCEKDQKEQEKAEKEESAKNIN